MEEIEQKKKELKDWIKRIGFTQSKFARYYCYEYVSDNDEEINQFTEKFKKQLQRKSTSPTVIDKYLEYLYTLEEFDKIGYVRPTCIVENNFDTKFNRRIQFILFTFK